jgi:hypothetical protein
MSWFSPKADMSSSITSMSWHIEPDILERDGAAITPFIYGHTKIPVILDTDTIVKEITCSH